ncbi:hypothetical protein ABN028_34110 [Actinopolymorpha sp. B17G11]|uniref:hypothetical protein n=1 Tax=Actinopolymorpha sp. B17G11 TaxID=3160861 RepID=UPI0032E4E196
MGVTCHGRDTRKLRTHSGIGWTVQHYARHKDVAYAELTDSGILLVNRKARAVL